MSSDDQAGWFVRLAIEGGLSKPGSPQSAGPPIRQTIRRDIGAHLRQKDLLPNAIALPHPSPRNAIWLKKHPWFESRVLPALKKRVAAALD